ncbi:SRPBCC family protein [Sphingomonas sp.]|uniref:SRPBCC family protein n=1 Tax=Sphingomonas sp. TaxID=28214 RepID=UPI003D6D0F4E
MTDRKTDDHDKGIELEYEIDEPPHKVWRAISIPEFRENWLPKEALADPEATSLTPGHEVRYRMRESDPPFLESVVTFRIAPNATGGTSLRIIHQLADVRFGRMTRAAANNNSLPLMLAA